MGVRNRRPDLNGFLVIDKPPGWTSADVCRFIRRRTGGAKVGHAGALDPLATGVLVICIGRATRLVQEIMGKEKAYRADIELSAFSTTDDAEGERLQVDVPTPPTIETIQRVLNDRFTGRLAQRPPAFSAVKIRGRRAYRMARAGVHVRPDARAVDVHSIRVDSYDWPRLSLDIVCGKGTYIRSIARDLGEALGTGGMLTGLVRTRIGRFGLDTAQSPENLPDTIGSGDLEPIAQPRG